MATTSTIIQALKAEIEQKIAEKGLFWPAGREKAVAPKVHSYTLPLNQKREEKDWPYIVIKFDEETQNLDDGTVDVSTLRLELIVGICSDSEDVQTGMKKIMAAVEWVEIELKDIVCVDDQATLKKVRKKIALEQPFPVFEGRLFLEYEYYKPIFREQP